MACTGPAYHCVWSHVSGGWRHSVVYSYTTGRFGEPVSTAVAPITAVDMDPLMHLTTLRSISI